MPQDTNDPRIRDCCAGIIESCHALLFAYMKFIEERCYKAYGLWAGSFADNIPGANKADALLVAVMEHLSNAGYRVLMEFKGNSSFKRYLDAIICNKAVDLHRQKEGRDRAAEEARKFGDIGIRLHHLINKNELPVEEAYIIMSREPGFDCDLNTLKDMAQKITGKRAIHHSEQTEYSQTSEGPDDESGSHSQGGRCLTDDFGQVTVADETYGPERIFLEKEKDAQKLLAVMEVIKLLTPEERLIVRLKYVDGRSVREISLAIGCSEKNAYRKISAMLQKCRGMLDKKGLGMDEIL